MTYSIKDIETKLIRQKAILDERQKELDLVSSTVSKLKTQSVLYSEAIELAKNSLLRVLENIEFIEQTVSSGLTEIFGTEHVFKLEKILDGGILKGLKPRLKEGNGEFDDPLQSFGDGQISIITVCLKLAVLLLNNKTEKILIMDEPLANVSPLLQSRFEAFIKNLVAETDLQLIIVTHMDEPFGDIYQIHRQKGKSVVKHYGSNY